MSELILKLSHLSKKFNVEAGFFSRNKKNVYAVQDVSFEIKKGNSYGLVGESGCGKTTTARLIVRMFEKNGGNIVFFDEKGERDVSSLSGKELKKYRERIKYVFQDPSRSLNPRMTVFQILCSGLKYSSLWKGKNDAWNKASKIIEEVGLNIEDLNRKPSDFSGGQRQRISIARGLIMEPDVLVCDEVVSALDVSIQGQIINLLQELKEKHNLSYIFITHDLKVACYFCDKIGVMYRGFLVEEGPAMDLYKKALHPYTELLFQGSSLFKNYSSEEVSSTLQEQNSCPFFSRCNKAKDCCRKSLPEMKVLDDGRKVRCFFPNGNK